MDRRAERIADAADPRIRPFAGVGDPALARACGVFVAEGRLVVRRVIAHGGYRVRALLLSDGAREDLDDVIAALPAGADLWRASPEVVRAVTGYDIHRGCLALVDRPAPRPWRDVVPADPEPATLVALEALANPDNIGGVFRNAAAFGAAAVLLDPASSDPLYRKAVRTSMGAAIAVPFARIAPWPAALADLRALGWTIAALTTAGDETLEEFTARAGAGGRIAWLAGHEGDGLSDAALAAADARVRIPMAEGADSINVATAVALALHASVAFRHR